MMNVNIGSLRHRVQIYNPLPSTVDAKKDARIQYPVAPTAEAFAAIEALVGRELLFARQIRADISYKFMMRYNGVVNHRTKIMWNGRTFNCASVSNRDTRNWIITFYAFEIL
jgi:SPP1 family predicted phage head-tail adaptor